MSAASPAARLARRTAAALVAVAAALLAAELLARAAGVRPFPAWSPRYLHVADPELGLVPSPSFVGRQETDEFSVEIRTNRLGLRSPEPASDGERCVCVLGDSFAFGHGVAQDETVASRLQAILRTPVQDAGVMSYGTWQATARLRRLARELHPTTCVLLFYAGNDALDNVHKALTVRDGYVMNAADDLTLPKRLKLWFKYRSSLYRVLVEALHHPEIPGLCSDHPSTGFDLFRVARTRAVEDAWKLTLADLAALRELCASLASPLVVVCLPARYQVEPAWWQRHARACGFAERDFDLRRVQTELGAFCADAGIPYLDVLDDFRASGESLYYQALLEMHLNARGHALLAELVARFLTANALAGDPH